MLGCRDAPPVDAVDRVRRSQRDRSLGKLSCSLHSAAPTRVRRCRVERRCDLVIGAGGGDREVACAFLRIDIQVGPIAVALDPEQRFDQTDLRDQVQAAVEQALAPVLAARETVYMFESDTPTRSTCSGACAAVWPPVTGGAHAGGGALAADLGTITRADGTKQVTYKGHPLYYFIADHKPGDITGQDIDAFGGPWYVISPSGKQIV